MMNDKRLLGGAAAVAIVAALGGFGIARWTASEPAATEAASGNAAAPAEEEKTPDTVTMTAQAIQQAGISTETLNPGRTEEHTSDLQSLMRISYAVFCVKKTTHHNN